VLLRKTREWEEREDSLNEELITRTETEETRAFDQWTLITSIIVKQLDTSFFIHLIAYIQCTLNNMEY
jgi:hypothetical protein